MQRTRPEQIGKLIEKMISDYNLDKPATAHKASWLWSQVVGPGVNSYTTKRYVVDGVLHVWISSAPLKQELTFQRQRIIEAINERLQRDYLTDLRIH